VTPPPVEPEEPLRVDREVQDQCLWSSDESTALCTLRRDLGFGLEHELSFVSAKGKADKLTLAKFKGDAFTEVPPSMVPEPARAALRARIAEKHYRAIADDEECKVLESEQSPARVDLPTFSVRLTLEDHGYGCPGGHCGKALGQYDLACASPKAKPKWRRVMTLTSHSIVTSNTSRVCLLDHRFVLVTGDIGGRNEEGYRGERSAAVIDLDTECPKPK